MAWLTVGDKIKFDGEGQRYTVQAVNKRYVVATKPFNAQKTFIYTIVDLEKKIRGAIGLVFGLPYDVNNPAGAEQLLKDMHYLDWRVSYHNRVPLTQAELDQLIEPEVFLPPNQGKVT